ncbi:MAG: hypothetical protein V2I76_04360 [Roseobacter sp.]|jgi:hypothetical protein|nr:hypothetical protein [Roseobacter sp.]
MTSKHIYRDPTQGRVSPLRVFGLCLAVILAFIAVDLLVFADGASFKREGGGLETASAVLYIVAAVVFLRVVPEGSLTRLVHVPLLMVLFALRELDFDKAFTSSGILSLRLYSGDSPLTTKLIAGAVAVAAVFVILRTVWVGVPAAWRALRTGAVWPWYAAAAGGVVVVAKSIDGLGRKLLEFGIVISDDLDATAALVEEVGEAFIPVFAMMAVFSRWRGGMVDGGGGRGPASH